MRVLFLTHRLPYAPNRGDRIRAYHLLQYLSRHASVDLLSLVHDRDEERSVAGVPAQTVTVVRTTPGRNKWRSALQLPSATPLTHTLLDAPDLLPALNDVLRRNRPDVVLAYCSGIARLALASPLAALPLVLDMVDVDSGKWEALSQTTRLPLRWIYRREAKCLGRFESRIVEHARTTLVVNERERQALADAAPLADVRTIPNGVELGKFRPRSTRGSEPNVVFCGVLSYRPNEDAALRLIERIWPRIRASRPDARLSIVGAEPTARLVRAAAFDPSVRITGAVPDVCPYLWDAAVSVAPLTVARGLQNKVLEALAADLPVVTTRAVADGLPAAVLPGCVVADEDDEIAGAVIALLGRTVTERRTVARSAELSGLDWGTQLAPLMPILHAAVRAEPAARAS